MKITKDTPVHQRRQIYVGSQVEVDIMNTREFHFSKILLDTITYTGLFKMLTNPKKASYNYIVKKPQSCLIDDAVNEFTFPPYHPVSNTIYSCSDSDPNLYIPLAEFHEYVFQSKLSSFKELCSTLGAKNCIITYAEEDGIDITAKVKAENIPTEAGVIDGDINGSSSTKKDAILKFNCSFAKPKAPIKEYKSNWMKSESSWITLQKIRLEGGCKKDKAEVSYTDDMNINVDLALKLEKMGVGIGGTFKKIKTRKLTYEIEFWPIED
ncbi:hypothetical protein DR871_013810 [Flavobacterium petrolei]|uniref:Uncharacterized protein n=1 Tax=Flavobacterium petrolei TaxID=2259594 RepID=A0A482TIQ3_9FLAO|nr:hypothetical protein [Flavobacterium petrolei]RYJ50997.1 hypothetical protein DR871_013810 [Flavobacterium petrolei]